MNTTQIRLAIPGDEAGIHDAHMRSIREICVKDHGPNEIRGWGFRELGSRWVNTIQKEDVWVVEDQKVIRGLGYIRIFEQDGINKAYLHALYLTPEIIGKKFAHQLMVLMLDKAKKSGASGVDLESTITAHNFYKRYGFLDTGSVKQVDIGGYPVTAYPMRLQF